MAVTWSATAVTSRMALARYGKACPDREKSSWTHLVVTDPHARLPDFHRYFDGLTARR